MAFTPRATHPGAGDVIEALDHCANSVITSNTLHHGSEADLGAVGDRSGSAG